MKASELLELAPTTCRATVDLQSSMTVLRAGGAAISSDARDELLARAVAGQYVEIEVDLLAFEQEPDKPNRNFVRFRDGAMLKFGSSGKGTPFLRDHDQSNLLARGGTILSSKTEKVAEGHYRIMQTVKLTAPWAVEAALRGNLDRVSIGWNPTGDVNCSVCSKQIMTVCAHVPGDRLATKQMDDGSTRLVRDRAGDVTVEWIYTSAELVETSGVTVPAVPSAGVESIRAALSAFAATHPRGDEPQPQELPKMQKIASALSLATTATEDEILRSLESSRERLRLTEQSRDELAKQCAELSARDALYSAAAAKTAQDTFISEGILAGKIIPAGGLETSLRKYFELDANGAKAMLVDMPAITPVGAPRQSSAPEAVLSAKSKAGASVREVLSSNGVDPGLALKFAKQFGCKNPETVLATELGLNTET